MRLIYKIARRLRKFLGIQSPSECLIKRSQEEGLFRLENGVIHIHERAIGEEVAE